MEFASLAVNFPLVRKPRLWVGVWVQKSVAGKLTYSMLLPQGQQSQMKAADFSHTPEPRTSLAVADTWAPILQDPGPTVAGLDRWVHTRFPDLRSPDLYIEAAVLV